MNGGRDYDSACVGERRYSFLVKYARELEEIVSWFELDNDRLRRENRSLDYQLNDLTRES